MAVVATRNIFLDSELVPYGNGESWRVALPPSSFTCKANQMMRLTLVNFEMRKNWYEVNDTNNTFFIYDATAGQNILYPVIIPPGSYRAFAPASNTVAALTTPVAAVNTAYDYATNDLASALKYAIDKTLVTMNIGGIITDWSGENAGTQTYAARAYFTGTPSCTVKWNPVVRKFIVQLPAFAAAKQADLRVVFFQIKGGAGVLPAALQQYVRNTNIDIYGDWAFQDCFELLGGAPTRDANASSASSFKSGLLRSGTVANGAILGFVSPYVGQLNTIEAIYVRLSSTSTNNFQSAGLDRYLQGEDHTVCPSNIFARFPLNVVVYDDINPIVTYDDSGSNTFQTLLDTHQLTSFQCAITDDKGRPLPEIALGQAKDGMLSCKMTLRWEVIQLDQSLHTAPPSMDIAASLSPVGFVRPTNDMGGSNAQPTIAKPMAPPRFSSNKVGRQGA